MTVVSDLGDSAHAAETYVALRWSRTRLPKSVDPDKTRLRAAPVNVDRSHELRGSPCRRAPSYHGTSKFRRVSRGPLTYTARTIRRANELASTCRSSFFRRSLRVTTDEADGSRGKWAWLFVRTGEPELVGLRSTVHGTARSPGCLGDDRATLCAPPRRDVSDLAGGRGHGDRPPTVNRPNRIGTVCHPGRGDWSGRRTTRRKLQRERRPLWAAEVGRGARRAPDKVSPGPDVRRSVRGLLGTEFAHQRVSRPTRRGDDRVGCARRDGMVPKVAACVQALRSGVRRAHILNGTVPHALLARGVHRRGCRYH